MLIAKVTGFIRQKAGAKVFELLAPKPTPDHLGTPPSDDRHKMPMSSLKAKIQSRCGEFIGSESA